MLLLDAFRVHALHSPGNVAVADKRSGEEFVYRQIWNASELLGAHLIEQTAEGTLAAGEPVAIVGKTQPLALACIIACAKSKHPHYFVGEDVLTRGNPVEEKLANVCQVMRPPDTRPPDTHDASTSDASSGGADAEVSEDAEVFEGAAHLSVVVLAASNALAEAVKQRFGTSARVFSAEMMLSYIVPGMTDDFSCGCGAEDCSHGPFLQECMPSEWFAADGVFFADHTDNEALGDGIVEVTIAAHDEMLTAALMGESSNGDALGGDVGAGAYDRLPDDIDRTSSPSKKRIPLNLCNPHLAVALATGETITLE